MREDISKLIDNLKDKIEEKIIELVGPEGKKFREKYVSVEDYDSSDDKYHLKEYRISKLSVEQGHVFVLLSNEYGDREWCKLRDCSLGDMARFLERL